MKKILVVPSWYPTDIERFPGTFFREQARILENEFEFFVLYGLPRYYPSIRNFAFKRLQGQKLISPPEGNIFYFAQIYFGKIARYFPILKIFIERVNDYLFKKAFQNEFQKLIQKGFSPDLIHSHDILWGGIAGSFLGNNNNIPTLLTAHSILMLNYCNDNLKRLIKDTFKNTRKILVVSEHLKRNILMNDINCQPEVIGNLVNDDLFQIQRGERKPIFTIIFVTWHGFIKDNDTFFKSIKHLIEENVTDFEIIVVGGLINKTREIQENPVLSLAKEYKVENYCKFMGFVSREQMCFLYNSADLFVSTSISETFGVSAGEALCCGLPIVATKNGGMEDFLTERNSMLVNVQDHKAIAEAILKIKNNKIHFDPLQQRKSIVDKYGKKEFKKSLIAIYNDLISTRK